MVKAIWENMGFKNASKFVQSGKEGEDPDAPPQQPQEDPMQAMQMQMQMIAAQLDMQKKQAEINKIETAAILDLARAEAAEAGQQLAEYKATFDMLNAARQPQQGAASPSQQIQPRKDGGPVGKGQPYIVGEEGPEIIIPSEDGFVIPNGGESFPMSTYAPPENESYYIHNRDPNELMDRQLFPEKFKQTVDI